MNQPRYGFEPPQNHHSQAPYPHQQFSVYQTTSLHTNHPAQLISDSHDGDIRQSYECNRNVIPGLGLGFQPSAPGLPTSWAPPQVGDNRVPAQVPTSAGPEHLESTMVVDDHIEPTAYASAEEGEVSEGETGDLYEPREAGSSGPAVPKSNGIQHKANAEEVQVQGVTDGPPVATGTVVRNRSHSYSPYLSPREMDQPGPATNAITEGSRSHSSSDKRSEDVANSDHAVTCQASIPTKTLSGARKQAQDAILRLWPLNVRFQNYLDEGVDKDLLGSLFKDLGFQVESPKTEVSHTSGGVKPTPSSPSKQSVGSEADQQKQTTEPKTTPGKVQDKSEERKDRIARLLAEKETKSNNPVPGPAKALSTPGGQTGHKVAKTQSEKSKLLHQKMEALKKSREAREKSRLSPTSKIASNHTEGEHSSTVAAATIINPPISVEETMSMVSQVPTPSIGESPGGVHASSSIPGLFLSSAPHPAPFSQTSTQQDLRKSTGLDPTAQPFVRPFGQTRESRPFLIDVSDDDDHDDDDAEMDIDSPEHQSVSIFRASSPTMKASSFHGAPVLMDSASGFQISSPGPIATPPGITSDSSSKDDLASMNKKIEAMKQKIAEAEARKKAKLSRQASPVLTHSNGLSREDSLEATGGLRNQDASPDSPAINMLRENSPADLSTSNYEIASHRQPKVSEARGQDTGNEGRGRSRAASERLPVIEARRREQQLKLQALQSQIASIERDIEESLVEEEKLREFALDATSDCEPVQSALDTARFKIADPPIRITSMDTTPISSSNDGDVGGGSSSNGQGLASPQQHTAALAGQSGYKEATSNSNCGRLAQASDDAIPESPIQQGADDASSQSSDSEQDVVMEEDDNSNDGDMDDASDNYEPPDAPYSPSPDGSSKAPSLPFSPAPHADAVALLDTSDHEMEETTQLHPVAEIISTEQEDSLSGLREVDEVSEVDTSQPSGTNFVAYESPLQYFRAYRFHPEFSQAVGGGLRSLTYSNKIDVRKEICPDQLAGQNCPRGTQCEYQHFENMQAPDDQILLQLGACENYSDKRKQEFIAGLRHLLADFRNRKVRDFQALSQGIIDYRAQFHGDKSKILPLGNVSI